MAMKMGLLQDPQMSKVFKRAFGLDMSAAAAAGADGQPSNLNTNEDNDDTSFSSPVRDDDQKRPRSKPEPEPEPELTEEEQKEADEERMRKEEELQRKTAAINCKKVGNQYYSEKKFDEAMVEYKKAQELDPSECSFVLNESACLFMQCKWDDCIMCCEHAVEVCQQYFGDLKWTFKAYHRMGRVEEKRGNIQNAIDFYQKALVEKHDDKLRKYCRKLAKSLVKAEAKAMLDPELAETLKLEGIIV